MYGYICEDCGAHLDPGEECDCVQRRREKRERQVEATHLAEQEGMCEQLVLGGNIDGIKIV